MLGLDDERNHRETSGTAGLACRLLRALGHRLIEKEYLQVAVKIVEAGMERIKK